MTEAYVGVDNGKHRAYRSVNGLYQQWVGPRFDQPRDAIAYARTLRGIPSVQATRSAAHDLAGDKDTPRSRGDALPSGSPEQVAGPGVPEPAPSPHGAGSPALDFGL